MRISEINGTVTLSRCHPSFQGANLRIAFPQSLAELAGQPKQNQDMIVVWDEMGTGNGSLIATAEGPEASQPFRPEVKPVDAYVAAILDHVDLNKKFVKETLK